MTASTYSSWHTIKTTAVREMQILAKTRSVLITLLILILVMLGSIGFFTWQMNKDEGEDAGTSVATVGVESQLFDGSGLDAQGAADRAEAERLVRDGDVEAAIVAEGDTWEVISDGFPNTSVLSAAEALAEQQAQAKALESLGVDPAAYAAAAPQIEVKPVDVAEAAGEEDGTSEATFIRLLTAFVSLMIMIFTVITFAAQVGSRVTEEKSSRVVELVLASVRPMDFLAGKLLGTCLLYTSDAADE